MGILEMLKADVMARGGMVADKPRVPNNRKAVDKLKAAQQANADAGLTLAEKPERVYGPRKDDGELMRPGQRGLFYVLLGQLRTHNPDRWQAASTWWESGVQATLTKVACSAAIDRLREHLAAPVGQAPVAAPQPVADARKPRDAYTDIPNGYYAVKENPDVEGGKIHYYRVSRSKSGQYVNVQEMASDTLYPVRPWGRAIEILSTIRTRGPRDAAKLFGRTIGRCCRCGRTLTDEDSRTAGIGPDCAGKGMF